MIPVPYVQGQCLKCHMAGLPYAPKPELLVQPPVKADPADKDGQAPDGARTRRGPPPRWTGPGIPRSSRPASSASASTAARAAT